MPTADTGWVRRNHGQTISLNLSGRYIVSAQVRFRGVSRTSQLSRYGEASISPPGSWSYNTLPVPTDSSFDYHSTVVYVYGQAGYSVSITIDGNTKSGSFSGNNVFSHSRITTPQTSSISYSVSGSGFLTGPDIYHHRQGRTYGTRTWRSTDPTTVVNGQPTTHSGSINHGSATSWQKINGLQSNTGNTVNVQVEESAGPNTSNNDGTVDVQIIYEYIEYPSVVTDSAIDIGSTSATLRGNLLTTGGAPVYRGFEYGETDAYGNLISVGEGAVGSYSYHITGLSAQQLYHFRAYATATKYSEYYGSTWNLTAYGSDLTFETIVSPPTMHTYPAEDLTSTSATLRGRVLETGGFDPEVYFEYGKTDSFELGSIYKGVQGIGEYTHDLTVLDYDTKYYYRAYGISDGQYRGDGQTREYYTLYPYLPPPHDRGPATNYETSNRKPLYTFTVGDEAVNPADKYHVRIRWSKSIDISGRYFHQLESKEDNTFFEAYINDEWVVFPEEGIDPDIPVRVLPQEELPYGPVYWDAAGYDGDRYGYNSAPRITRIRVTVDIGYTLLISGEEWNVIDNLNVMESSNGEIGLINFTLSNEPSENLLTENQSSPEIDLTGFTASGGTITRSYDAAWYGEFGLKCEPSATMTVELDPVGVEAGSYIFSVYTYGQSGQAVNIRLEANGEHKTQSVVISQTNRWERVSVSLEVEADTDAVMKIISAGDVFYIDGLQLEKSNIRTPWKRGGVIVYADAIAYGAEVVLAIRDSLDHVLEFVGRVREKQPDGDLVQVGAITADGFLAERLAKSDYPTDVNKKTIDMFVAGDDGYVSRIESTEADWDDSFAEADVMVQDDSLTLASTEDYDFYNEGEEGIAWVEGYSSGGGVQSKEDDHFSIDTTGLEYDGGVKSYVSDVTVDLTYIKTIKAEWAVIPGPEIVFGTASFGIGANKMDDGFEIRRTRSSSLGRTTWTLDVSNFFGSYYLKLMCGHEDQSNLAVRFYRVWGEDEDGNVVVEYQADGYRTAQPLSLSAVVNVYHHQIDWNSSIPTGSSMTVECAVNEDNTTEPDTYATATSGEPIPGISAGEDLTGKYLWVKTSMTAGQVNTVSPQLHMIRVTIQDEGFFGVVVDCPGHGLETGDKTLIKGDNKYNGVWEVEKIDIDNFGVFTTFEEDPGAVGTSQLIEDIGLYVKHMVNTYCQPVTADDYVDVETGFIAPVEAKDKTLVRVLETIRRNYDVGYFVDRDFRFHFYKAEEVETPDHPFVMRRGRA